MTRHTTTALAASVLVAALLSSCSNGETGSRTATQRSETTTAPTAQSATTTGGRGAHRAGRFEASDGVELVGRLSGTGEVGVILAHGFSHGSAQDGWLQFAPALVSRGYTVLTFDFRGFCDSEGCSDRRGDLGKNWRDAMAAVRFMETRRAKKIFLIGASMGGLAVLRAARMPEVEIAG